MIKRGLFYLLFLLIGLIFFSTFASLSYAMPPKSTPTDIPRGSVTPTRERFAIPSPTAGPSVPAPFLTLTAFNAQIIGTLENRPTPTDGPSEITLNGKPHLIDFNAAWCAPCREMKPFLKELEAKYGEQINFWDINIDNRMSVKLEAKYNIEFIPVIIILDAEGELIRRLDGFHTEKEVETAIKDALGEQ